MRSSPNGGSGLGRRVPSAECPIPSGAAERKLGDAEGRVFHRFALTQAQIKELLGDPDHLYWDFEYRR